LKTVHSQAYLSLILSHFDRYIKEFYFIISI